MGLDMSTFSSPLWLFPSHFLLGDLVKANPGKCWSYELPKFFANGISTITATSPRYQWVNCHAAVLSVICIHCVAYKAVRRFLLSWLQYCIQCGLCCRWYYYTVLRLVDKYFFVISIYFLIKYCTTNFELSCSFNGNFVHFFFSVTGHIII